MLIFHYKYHYASFVLAFFSVSSQLSPQPSFYRKIACPVVQAQLPAPTFNPDSQSFLHRATSNQYSLSSWNPRCVSALGPFTAPTTLTTSMVATATIGSPVVLPLPLRLTRARTRLSSTFPRKSTTGSTQPAKKIVSTSEMLAGTLVITTTHTIGPGTSTATAPFLARALASSTDCPIIAETGGTEVSSRMVSLVPTKGLAFHFFSVSKLAPSLMAIQAQLSYPPTTHCSCALFVCWLCFQLHASKTKLINGMLHFIFHLLITRSDSCHWQHRLPFHVLPVCSSTSIPGSSPSRTAWKVQGGHVEAFGGRFLRK